MLRHFTVATLVAFLALLPAKRAQAQAGTTIDELILTVISDVSDLRFADAIARARQLLATSETLRADQEISLRTALAAAYYSDVGSEQQPDSALAQFARVVRLAPDATIPVTLAWDGLDSLLQVARTRTFAIALRPSADSMPIGGAQRATVTAVATRPAIYHLQTQRVGGGPRMTHSVQRSAARTATLELRADDGEGIILEPGAYDVILTAVDPTQGDSTSIARRVRVAGSLPALQPMIVLDSARLEPERIGARPWRTVGLAALFAGTTVGIAHEARAAEPVRSAFAVDGRAALVAGGLLVAAATAIWQGRDGVDAAAVTRNTAIREAHEATVAAIRAENARRIAAYRATVNFSSEGR